MNRTNPPEILRPNDAPALIRLWRKLEISLPGDRKRYFALASQAFG